MLLDEVPFITKSGLTKLFAQPFCMYDCTLHRRELYKNMHANASSFMFYVTSKLSLFSSRAQKRPCTRAIASTQEFSGLARLAMLQVPLTSAPFEHCVLRIINCVQRAFAHARTRARACGYHWRDMRLYYVTGITVHDGVQEHVLHLPLWRLPA